MNNSGYRVLLLISTIVLLVTPNAAKALDNALMFDCNEKAKTATVSMTESSFHESSDGWQASSKDSAFRVIVVPRRSDSEALSKYRWPCKLGSDEAVFEIWEEAPNSGKPGPGSATVITKLTLSYARQPVLVNSILDDSSQEYDIRKQLVRLSLDNKHRKGQLLLDIHATGYSRGLRSFADPSISIRILEGVYVTGRNTTLPLPLTDKALDPKLVWQ